MSERESIEQTLHQARSVLAVLEVQAAGYTNLTIPAHLKVELDQKRQEVATLEAKLNQLGFVANPPAPSCLAWGTRISQNNLLVRQVELLTQYITVFWA